MVADRVNSSSDDKSTVANTIQEFVPSSTRSPSGERRYQLVAWRSHPCGPVELGLVESVFRWSRKHRAKSMVFCADSFYPNQQGRASMKSYMSILRVTWKTLVERTPGYFETLLKATDISGKAPAMTNATFSRHVWSRFACAAPTTASQTGSFVSLLRAICEIAPPALPV
eukprot:s6680_g3.t1